MSTSSSGTTQFSWEYLMPKRKERMAGYIRESDTTMAADSTTMESQAKAVRQYAEKTGYSYDVSVHEYREAISAYTVPYMERKVLLEALAAAKRREFDVFVVSEIRALGRRQVEVFVLYDQLQKYGVRLETIQEKFEDSAIGRYILATRAMIAEVERENTYMRLQRGKKDRIEIGKAPPNGQRCYGYLLVDTDKETNARYEFNHTIMYVDEERNEWSEYKVVVYIFELLKQGFSLRGVATHLNDIGIPPPKKPVKLQAHWNAKCIYRIVHNPIYTGKVYCNRYKRIGKNLIERPHEEWILLPDPAPSYIDETTLAGIIKQLPFNKQDSLRNNKAYEEQGLGLLRGGYIFCGICKKRMYVRYPSPAEKKNGGTPQYRCESVNGKSQGVVNQHRTQIHTKHIDNLAKEKIIETLLHPEVVRQKVAAWRAENRLPVDPGDIETTVENIRAKMQNLYNLAENAPDDEVLADITARMQNLGKQKREAEAMLYNLEEAQEEREEIEEELVKFEQWVEKVKPHLTDPVYMANASYEELRLAVRILGLKTTIFPTSGDWPYRHHIDVTVPAVMAKVNIVWQSKT